MKKLFLFLLISFAFTNFSIADERVNLSCVFSETFHWDTLETNGTTGGGSLIVFPSIGKYIYDGIEGYYQTAGNKIKFSHVNHDAGGVGLRWDYSLDRTTTVFEQDFSVKSAKTGNKFKKGLTHKGKCEKTENLF